MPPLNPNTVKILEQTMKDFDIAIEEREKRIQSQKSEKRNDVIIAGMLFVASFTASQMLEFPYSLIFFMTNGIFGVALGRCIAQFMFRNHSEMYFPWYNEFRMFWLVITGKLMKEYENSEKRKEFVKKHLESEG